MVFLTSEEAIHLDERDPLGEYYDCFHHPLTDDGKPAIYLAGHSLGLAPKNTKVAVQKALEDWQTLGVRGHFIGEAPWLPYHERLSASLANLAGAKVEEVIAMNSLTVNLHLLMVSFYRPTSQRYKIVMEAHAFSSDRYAVVSHLKYHGYDPSTALILIEPNQEDFSTHEDQWKQVLTQHKEEIALIWVEHVNYLTGRANDIQAISKMAHSVGAYMGVDCAHSMGNLPLQLHDWEVDCAVWCSYKYLNGGPGTIGGAFIHQRHLNDNSIPRFAGWWGHDKTSRFKMGTTFEPMATAEAWQLSNPPILQLAALRASLDIFDEVGINALRKKSIALTSYLASLLKDEQHLTLLTPDNPEQRGCQLSLQIHHVAKAIHLEQYWWSLGMIVDFRPPNILRVAPVPLYTRFIDVYRFVQQLKVLLI